MDKEKPALRSVGVWGSLISLTSIVGILPEVIAFVQDIEPEVRTIITQIGVITGSVLALWGRLRAFAKIKGLF